MSKCEVCDGGIDAMALALKLHTCGSCSGDNLGSDEHYGKRTFLALSEDGFSRLDLHIHEEHGITLISGNGHIHTEPIEITLTPAQAVILTQRLLLAVRKIHEPDV